MALGLILRVSWICFLLFDCSAGIPTERGYGYPYKEDSNNIGDDGEDEALTSPTFESDWQASNNQPTGPVYTSYNKPAVAQWPGLVTSQHNYPNQDLNSGSTGGGSSSTHLVYEDVFQYPPENTGASSNTAGGYSQGYPMSKGSSTASTPEGPSLPSNPINEGAQPVHPSSGGEPLNLGQTLHQTREENPSPIPQTPAVSTQDVQVTQRLSEPIRPPPPSPPPLPRYIIQSRNGYQRARYLSSKSRYSPEFVSS